VSKVGGAELGSEHMGWLAAAWRALFSHERLVTGTLELAKLVIGALIIYAILGWMVRAAIRASSRRLPDPIHRQRVTTLLLLIGDIARYVFIFVVGYWVLRNLFGFDMAPVLMSVGVVGLAVGFGAQNLVRDVVAGFFIIMEGQYGVGDVVEINGMFGEVEEVGLRTTKLRDPNGELRYIPNGTITQANRYTERCIAYRAVVPLAEGEYDAAGIVRQALQDFDRELHAFTAAPEVGPAEMLASYARVLPVSLRVAPGRQGLVTEKLAARLTAAIQRAGHPLPEGTEVSLALAYEGGCAEG